MLENIREGSQGWIAKSILGLVILTFALAGIGSYTNSVDTSVAEVNGQKITQNNFNKAYQAQRNRMAQQFGEMFETLSADANYMANFRNGVLEGLIDQALVDQSIANMAIRVSDERIKNTIRTMKEFQVDGVFDNNRYLAIINQAGFFQSSDFRDYLRVEMTRRQLTQSLVVSEINLPYQTELLSTLQNQKRDLRFATIDAEQFKADIVLSDDEVNQYYQANQIQFQNKEQAKVNYIALDVNDIAKGIEITDADISNYYQENIANFTKEEQRRVAHILVEFGDDEATAKQQAEKLLARIHSGDDFSELAKQFSSDTFSGENGGDLDWIEPGVMDEAFDASAFALKDVGAISDLVKTEFGFHIIKLTDLKEKQVQALADIKQELTIKVSTEIAQDKFFELQQEMARLSFEYPDTLEDAAGAINVKVKTSDWLKRSGNIAPFNDVKVIDAVFSDLVIEENANSDVIEVSDTLAVVVRLEEYQAAKVKPLAEVSQSIRDILVANKATEKAQTLAGDLLNSFIAGEDIQAQLTAVNASFVAQSDVARYGNDIDNNLSQAAFKLPHPSAEYKSATTVTLSNGDLALLEVVAVKTAQAVENTNMAQQLNQQLAQSSYQSFVDSLKVDAKIVRRAISEPTSQY